MADNQHHADPAHQATFSWHPDYRGQTVAAVRSALANQIASDQRAYTLTLEGAEEHEGDSLSSVIALERKWGPFDLNWAESDPGLLADQIVAFELERDRRQELLPYATYRETQASTTTASYHDPASAQRLESPAARGIVVLIVLLILVAAWFLVFR